MTQNESQNGDTPGDLSPRLDSWKDVAAYLKRDVTTVQRWERRERLPIHRHVHDKLGSIYAYRHELDDWQRRRSRKAETDSSTSVSGVTAQPRRANRRLIALGLTAALVIAVGAGAFWYRSAAAARPEISSLVVLPLTTLSADVSQAYLAAGLTEALTTRLASLRGLRVVSTTSALAVERQQLALPAIAQELGVDAVVEGSVLHQGSRLKISIRLIDARTDTHLMTRDFEAEASTLLQIESDIARAVAAAVREQIGPDEAAQLASVPAVDPRAHEEYLLGRYLLWKFIEEDRIQAMAHFERAIEIAPDYAPPYAGLAHAWWMRGIFGPLSIKDVVNPARVAARQALERDGRLVEAYAAQAYVEGIFDWNWAAAEATIESAMTFGHDSVDVHYVHALLLMAMGRLDEAVAEIDRAEQLDPLSAQVQSTFGRILSRARRFDEAAVRLHRAIELEPRSSTHRGRLADVYRLTGRHDDALRTYEEVRALTQDKTAYQSEIALTYVHMGRAADARRLIATAQPGFVSAVYLALGETETAFNQLFRAVEKREDWYPFIKADPDFEPLHQDPRWRRLLQRMNLDDD